VTKTESDPSLSAHHASAFFAFAPLNFAFGASFFFRWLSRMWLARETATLRRSGRYPRFAVLPTTDR